GARPPRPPAQPRRGRPAGRATRAAARWTSSTSPGAAQASRRHPACATACPPHGPAPAAGPAPAGGCRRVKERVLSLLFVMDPIGSIDIAKDTTFVLMLEGQRRGHRVLYCELGDLSVEEGRPVARLRPVTLRREVGRHFDLGDCRTAVLDDEVDVVFQRKDPPVDASYAAATQILTLCRRALVLNRPDTLLWANEKLYALQFPELMPETRVSRRISEFVDFLAKLGGEMIVKPLDGKAGE